MRIKKSQQSNASDKCPVTFALDIFGDRWSLIILREMVFRQKRYYGEFLSTAEKISTNILAARLNKLEAEGIITKVQDKHNLSKNVYTLTQKGVDLIPLLLEMIEWSVTYNPQPDVPDNIISGAPAHLLKRSKEERATLIDEIVSKIDIDG